MGTEAARAAWTVWQAGLSQPFTLPVELPPLRALGLGQPGRP
jgi:hypothetical protein